MNNIEKLMVNHAFWADKVRELKAAGEAAYDKCLGLNEDTSPFTCIETVFNEWKSSLTGHPGEDIGFEETWQDAMLEGDVCKYCQEVRRLKAERMNARRRLGNVRAAITRVGRKLAQEG